MKLLWIALAAGSAFAQTKSLACDQQSRRESHQVNVCEMREQTIAYGGKLTVDGGRNGGVSVKGWDGPGVLVRSKVDAWGPDDGAAKSVLSQVHVDFSAGELHASGPEHGENQWFAVSFEVFVPRNADLSLKAHNGGISIADVRGHIQFVTTNGGVHLNNLAGDVEGETKNGGLNIALSGNRWDGTKLDARTKNGAVNISMPQNYSAHFETATVNGHVNANFDMPVQASLNQRNERIKKLSSDIGGGGPTIHVETTNGGVNFKKI
jgi:DUF4097 and DUF4098 domain-containing protein YvlB